MRSFASLENAQRYLTTLRRTAARVRPRDLAKVVAGVAAVLLFLELIYLIIGNAVLRSQLIQRAVADADGFHLDFGSAYTIWPGRVEVRDFSLRVEDYNVQFEVAIDRGELDIALGQLPFKKFRITRLIADGTRFRMRHKLISVGDDAERVRAYPPIRGFADPPYYVGVRPPPIPDDQYDLWQVKVENVSARARELWVMEYRFVGSAEAHGSFVVKPTRWVQVEPASLRLDSGKLTLGEHLVAQQVHGQITCDVPDMRVPETQGRQVFRDISAGIRLALTGGRLDFLQAYLARLGGAGYSGQGEWRIDVNMQRGVLQPGSSVALRATPFQVHRGELVAAGNLALLLERPAPVRAKQPKQGDELWLALTAPHIALGRGRVDAEPPSLQGVTGSLSLHAADIKGDLSVGDGRLAVSRALVPALAWFDEKEWRLAGSAQAHFELARDPGGALRGRTQLRARDVQLQHRDLRVSGDISAASAFSRRVSQPFELASLELGLSGLSLAKGKSHSEPVDIGVQGSGLSVDPSAGWVTRGELQVNATSSQALLPLLVGEPLRDLTSAALDLQALQARVGLELSKRGLSLHVIDARSGRLRLRGYFDQRSQPARGMFLLSSGAINVGITLEGGETKVSPFVGDDWLKASWTPPLRR